MFDDSALFEVLLVLPTGFNGALSGGLVTAPGVGMVGPTWEFVPNYTANGWQLVRITATLAPNLSRLFSHLKKMLTD
jgi:hypothetical protein